MRNMFLLLPVVLFPIVSGCSKKDDPKRPPAPDSTAAHWLDGSERDLKQFTAAREHVVVNIKPKRLANLLNLLYSKPQQGVYAVMITETSDTAAFAEGIIVKLPADEAARKDYLAGVKEFFSSRGYSEEAVTIDKKDPRFVFLDPNPGGGVLTLGSQDDP